jgi:hypothetical protein
MTVGFINQLILFDKDISLLIFYQVYAVLDGLFSVKIAKIG